MITERTPGLVNKRILLIEDDKKLAQLVCDYLGQNGLSVQHEGLKSLGLQVLQEQVFDAVVLDLMLPDGDGLDLCRELRQFSAVPLLMLTARGDPMDRVLGLEMGADDYLPKPFEPRELLARLKAMMRRHALSSGQGHARPRSLRFGRLEIDVDARRVRVDEEEKGLTAYQFDLLLAMSAQPGRVLSRDFLMDTVKGEALEAFDRSIDVHMSRIRALIEDDPKQPKRILTVRGSGYVFAKGQH